MRFENGSFCRIDCSRRCAYGYDQRVEVFGSSGSVSSSNLHRSGITRASGTGTESRDVLLNDFMARYLPTYASELNAFIEACSQNTPLSPSFESGRQALALADAALASARSGTPISVRL
jgi:myo-inositol 2-dehydrogenase/D-chiro-inositol 1-dehydrogenase